MHGSCVLNPMFPAGSDACPHRGLTVSRLERLCKGQRCRHQHDIRCHQRILSTGVVVRDAWLRACRVGPLVETMDASGQEHALASGAAAFSEVSTQEQQLEFDFGGLQLEEKLAATVERVTKPLLKLGSLFSALLFQQLSSRPPVLVQRVRMALTEGILAWAQPSDRTVTGIMIITITSTAHANATVRLVDQQQLVLRLRDGNVQSSKVEPLFFDVYMERFQRG